VKEANMSPGLKWVLVARSGEMMTSGEMCGNWSSLYFRWLSQMMPE